MKVKTQRARRVLNDAISALEKFNEEPIDTEFRHAVVLCCVLIRTVGDALKNENEEDAIANKTQNDYFRQNIQSDVLFKNFIKDARDTIIHEYIAHIGWASITDFNNNHRMEYLIKNGSFEGEDFREIMQRSINFWEYHLSTIENI